ncbi:glycoside hydrolase family 15 protein [Effusibacillus consociatus]|uniref:Glycoside hydrolase family 15 protein n=1 Tax=Effusibacillus consociatus TaxID=1117041 RepID=A0ABV9PZZ1_9BACL
MQALHTVLDSMRLPNGAYIASPSNDYSYVWIRDVGYAVLPYLNSNCDRYEKTYHALLDLFRRYEWKIDIHTRQKPVLPYEYIHARYSKDLTELLQPWGHAQNDSIGLFLWGVGEGVRRGKPILRDEADRRILQKLVDYLACLEYWQEPDNGMWEENVEIHASSVGACVAGLKSIRMLVDVPEELIRNGEQTLSKLLPRESLTKKTDLALLSLIYPYQVVSRDMAFHILYDVATKLERKYGCIRYKGDRYYNEGREAEWCFGFPWLGLCHAVLGEEEKVLEYWEKTKQIIPENGEIPELYIGGTDRPNGNTPLAWAVAMTILLHERVQKMALVRVNT